MAGNEQELGLQWHDMMEISNKERFITMDIFNDVNPSLDYHNDMWNRWADYHNMLQVHVCSTFECNSTYQMIYVLIYIN